MPSQAAFSLSTTAPLPHACTHTLLFAHLPLRAHVPSCRNTLHRLARFLRLLRTSPYTWTCHFVAVLRHAHLLAFHSCTYCATRLRPKRYLVQHLYVCDTDIPTPPPPFWLLSTAAKAHTRVSHQAFCTALPPSSTQLGRRLAGTSVATSIPPTRFTRCMATRSSSSCVFSVRNLRSSLHLCLM